MSINNTLFFLLIFFFSIVNVAISQSDDTKYKIAAVGFYNFENLFDTIDTEGVWDTEFTPEGSKQWNSEKYQEKLNNLAYVIEKIGTDKAPQGVSVLGVSEIENEEVLIDLVEKTSLADKNFGVVHHHSKDERGIDVALLYRKEHFTVTNQQAYFVDMSGIQKSDDDYFTRDVLLVSGKLDGEEMHFLINHWPSRRGGEKRSEPGRLKAAQVNKMVVDSLYTADPQAKIVIMGDLNDNPTNKSLTKVLEAKNSPKKCKALDLYNPMESLFRNGTGSNAWRDSWSLFDQLVVSSPLCDNDKSGYEFFKAYVFNPKFLQQPIGQYKGYPFRTFVGDAFQGGYSDHFPVYLYLVKEI